MSNLDAPDFEKPPLKPIKVHFTGSKVIVWNPSDGSRLYRLGYYGRPLGIRKPKSTSINRPFELTLLEALYLLEYGHIEVIYNNEPIEFKPFKKLVFSLGFHLLEDLYFVYKDLRLLRYIPKPGLKFGSDFTVYKKGPGIDHAPNLIRVFPRGSNIHPLDLVAAGRIANSVKKRYIMATVMSDKQPTIRYYEFKWTKP
ncbi:MAG: tRNA-intron lyase [Candidatus Hodarchaeales archaeon]